MNLDDLYSIMKAPPELIDWQRFRKYLDGVLNWFECWEWSGAMAHDYAIFNSRKYVPKLPTRSAHRLMAIWTYGHGGECVDHVVCNNSRCVNPLHLLPTTYQFNNTRPGAPTASQINMLKTHCKNGHEFTPDNLSTRPSDIGRRRRCLACTKNLKN